jgi:hypothetical protein
VIADDAVDADDIVVSVADVAAAASRSLNRTSSCGWHDTLATSGSRMPRSISSSRVARTEIFRSRPEKNQFHLPFKGPQKFTQIRDFWFDSKPSGNPA